MGQIHLGSGPPIPVITVMADEDPFELAIREIEATINNDGWDQAASLFTASSVPGVGMTVAQVPLPPETFSDVHLGLRLLHDIVTDGENSTLIKETGIVPRNFLGLILSTEAWTVGEPDQGDVEAHAEWVRAAEAKEFHKHADRVEGRIVVGVFGTGHYVKLFRMRGETPVCTVLPPERLSESREQIGKEAISSLLALLAFAFHDASEYDPVVRVQDSE